MTTYLIVKWIHVLSSVLLVGTGFGTAYFMFFANRSQSVTAQAVVARLVVRADWWFTTPAAVTQPGPPPRIDVRKRLPSGSSTDYKPAYTDVETALQRRIKLKGINQ